MYPLFCRKGRILMVTKCTSKRISIHIQRSPGCTVTSIVPAFTYASRLPVTRQPAGVLAAVGYTRYLALVPPPVVSITNEIRYFTSYQAFSSGSQRCHVTTRALCCDSRRTAFHIPAEAYFFGALLQRLFPQEYSSRQRNSPSGPR